MSLPLPDTFSGDMPALLSYMEVHFYLPITGQCKKLAIHTAPANKTHAPAIKTYHDLCHQLFEQWDIYNQTREVILLPYISELAEKQNNGHDCRSCATSCTIRHTTRIMGIREAHIKINSLLEQLQQATLPAYRQSSSGADQTQALYPEMQQLTYLLTRLLYMEEHVLIPKLIAAQKNIYAHD